MRDELAAGADLESWIAEARRELQQGHLTKAEQWCAQVLDRHPQRLDALQMMGAICGETGRNTRAVALLSEAVALAPNDPVARTNFAAVLRAVGRSAEALEQLDLAAGVAPPPPHMLMNRALVLWDLGRWAEAAGCAEQWVAQDPASARAYRLLGDCYSRQGLRGQAVGPYAKSLSIEPDSVETANNLGACLADGGNNAEALAVLCHSVERHPENAAAWANLGVTAKASGDLNTALRCFDRALALDSSYANARWNRSLCLLGQGRLGDGWPEYEWRWKASEHCEARPCGQPLWEGSDPAGKRILVWLEQGLGDRILCAGMLPDLLRAGARLIVECDLRLVKLFARSFPDAEVVPDTQPPHARTRQPDIDFQIPIASLARWFRGGLKDFPDHRGYLIPDGARRAVWKDRFAALGDGLKVGICWRSGLARGMRSVFYSALCQWEPILTLQGAHFVNLQYDECAEELEQVRRQLGTDVARWPDMDLKRDQDGVAAMIAELDLVISAGTAVDQMAGAVGTPTWVLTRGAHDVWSLGTDHCPWYPSVRVFRCGAQEPWEPVIARMGSELGRMVEERVRELEAIRG